MGFRRGLNVASSAEDAARTPCVYFQRGCCRDRRCHFMHSSKGSPEQSRTAGSPEQSRTAGSPEQSRTAGEAEAIWCKDVEQFLDQNGGRCELCSLAGAKRVPDEIRHRRYSELLEANGFQIIGSTVIKPMASGGSQRRPRDDDDSEPAHAKRPRTGSPSKDDAEEARRAQRQQRFGFAAPGKPPRAAPMVPDTAGDMLRSLRAHGLQKIHLPKSANQAAFQANLKDRSVHIMIGLGSSGAGKTLFAVQEGLNALIDGDVERVN